jgi:hypothetical protein
MRRTHRAEITSVTVRRPHPLNLTCPDGLALLAYILPTSSLPRHPSDSLYHVEQQSGILVTGLPRSGTSWVGKMLEASGRAVYVNEPLNPSHPPGRSPGVLNAEVSHRYQYICADNEDRWIRAYHDTLRLRYHLLAELRRNHRPYDLGRLAKYFTTFTAGRIRHSRVLLDDPFAIFSSAWFAERLGCQVIICVRHPVAFVASWQRLGWTARFEHFLAQPLLMRDLLWPYEAEMRALNASGDRIARAALLWRMTYAVVGDLTQRVSGLQVYRYEDLASQPLERFRDLYGVCGLAWSERARRRIAMATAGQQRPGQQRLKSPHAWSIRGGLSRTAFRSMDSRAAIHSYRDRLTPMEIDMVENLTADVAKRYFGDGSSFPP